VSKEVVGDNIIFHYAASLHCHSLLGGVDSVLVFGEGCCACCLHVVVHCFACCCCCYLLVICMLLLLLHVVVLHVVVATCLRLTGANTTCRGTCRLESFALVWARNSRTDDSELRGWC
jgi:hypothetical protein